MKKFGASMNLVRLGNSLHEQGPESLQELLMACHVRIRRFARLAFTLGAQRTTPAAEVHEVATQCLRYFSEALPLHVRDEEDSIAPRMAGHSAALDATLGRMRAEHITHDVRLHSLADALRAVSHQPNHAVLHRQLAREAATLETDLEEHLRFEEFELFPYLDEVLPAQTQALIILELRARRRASA